MDSVLSIPTEQALDLDLALLTNHILMLGKPYQFFNASLQLLFFGDTGNQLLVLFNTLSFQVFMRSDLI